jgi:CubicO group peptidase (beta-lactamase class C family)
MRYPNKKSVYFLLILISFFSCQLIFPQTKAEKIETLLNQYYKFHEFNGAALVAEEGKVIYKNGFGMADMEWNIPNTPDTRFRLGSITKQFTAMIIMQLVEEGKLKLDVPITTYIPDYPKDKGEKITIHNLLTHTSGIPNYTDQASFREIMRNPITPIDLIKTFWNLPLDFEPGTKFKYSNSGYIVLGYIIEKVTGKTYEEVLKEKIFKPLGMKNSGYDHSSDIIPKRASGYNKSGTDYFNAAYIDMSVPFSAGALYSTVEDLYLWDQALYTDKLLSKKYMDKIFTPYSKPPFADSYGYGWGISKKHISNINDSLNINLHGGAINGFNTIIERITNNKDLIVLLNNTGGTKLNEMSDKIIDILYNQKYEMPEKPLLLSFVEILKANGIEKASDFYNKSIDKGEKISEGEMNRLGYGYLNKKEYTKAVGIFKLNTKAYPESYNVYDSYGEALRDAGNKEEAVKNYKKSIEINPRNINGIEKLKELGVDAELPKDAEVNPDIYDLLVGKYELNPQFILTVTTTDGKLYVQGTGQQKIEVFPTSELEYYSKVVNAQITFVKDENGKISKLILHQNGKNMPAPRNE